MLPAVTPIDRAFTALSHPVRRNIIERLLEGELTVGEIARPYGLRNPTISRHLKVLKEAQLIVSTVDGRQHRCRINPNGINELQSWLKRYEKFWTGQFDALQRFVETRPVADRS
ncbi:MAG: metalloregulator ArsR/SmtB family transcription factor [Pseudomonadales bacterium]|nr:winged helix-turn-helix transcriptional regulator [Pseudomonadales bacterium]